MTTSTSDRILSQFLFHVDSARLTLLHPDSRFRSLLIAQLLNQTATPVFYYALGPEDIDVEAFTSGLVHDLAAQHPTFGRHLCLVKPDATTNLDQLTDALARDLEELCETRYYLILDEYDRSDAADDIQALIEQLTAKLPAQCHLVINSRTLPRLSWISLIARGYAVIVRDDQLVKQNFYGPKSTDGPLLDVFALGPGFVLLNDRPIDSWEGHLPRLLFFFSLDRPAITRSEICQAFWPELDTDQAVNVFHVTKRRLHKALAMDVLVHEDGYYQINPALEVRYDAEIFVTALVDGRSQEGAAGLPHWQRAIECYRGPFLQGHSDEWIVKRRHDFRAGYLEALIALARIRLEENRPEHALSLYQRALGEDIFREDLHQALMRLYTQLGRRSEAAAHYQRLVEEMRRLGHTLSEETHAVYQELMG